jgi:hypothetical protein
MNTSCITDIEINFILDGSTLICSTSLSLIVDSIELLDSNGRRIAGPSRNVSFIHHNLNGSEMRNSYYICRVNSTLGSKTLSVFIETEQHDSVTTMTTMTTGIYDLHVVV